MKLSAARDVPVEAEDKRIATSSVPVRILGRENKEGDKGGVCMMGPRKIEG
jgi:hypothetical protein